MRMKRLRVVAGAVAGAAALLVVAYLVIGHVSYRMQCSISMALAVGHVSSYWQDHGMLPDSLAEWAHCRMPSHAWERTPSGPFPWYLPGRTDDATVRFVLLVDPAAAGSGGRRSYGVLGDSTVHYVSEDELREILIEDDLRREQHGAEGRWRDIPWQFSRGGADSQ